MNDLSFEHLDFDGVVCTGRLTIDTVEIETPNCFPALRTTKTPNELDLLIAEQGKYPLEHLSGAVVRLYHVPTLIEPYTTKLAEEEKHPQKTLDGTVLRSPYGTFYNGNLLICDPCLEYTLILNAEMDKRFSHLNAIPTLKNYFIQFDKNKNVLENPDDVKIRKLRRAMYNDLWFGSSKDARKDRNKMLTDLTKYQLQHFRLSVPGGNLIQTPDDVKSNIDVNEFCQGLAYQAGKKCATYLPFHRNAIKNDEVMGKAIDYLRSNKQSKLNIVKPKDLDLHCPVDYKARTAFKNFLTDIISIKEDQPDRAFMILDAGTQYYVSMQAFDIVSTTLTGFDRDIMGGNREEGKKYYPLWYDELKMWTRPTNDAPKPNPEHCYVCAETPNFDFDDDIIARKKRIHRLNDLNKDAKAICDAVPTNDVGHVMKVRVAFAEFSYARDLILSP